jgi:hypothetical protein
VAQAEYDQENSRDDSQQGMQQGIRDIEKRGIAERGQVGAVRDQNEAEDEKPLGGAGKALLALFHDGELVNPVYKTCTTDNPKRRALLVSSLFGICPIASLYYCAGFFK